MAFYFGMETAYRKKGRGYSWSFAFWERCR